MGELQRDQSQSELGLEDSPCAQTQGDYQETQGQRPHPYHLIDDTGCHEKPTGSFEQTIVQVLGSDLEQTARASSDPADDHTQVATNGVARSRGH